VSNVEAERTGIPAGGEFSCVEDRRDLRLKESDQVGLSTRCLDHNPIVNSHCDADRTAVVGRMASHWSQTVDLTKGRIDGHGEPLGAEVLSWNSDDLLTSFTMHRGGEDPLKVSVTRRTCSPVTPELAPLPSSEIVSCDEHYLSFGDNWSAASQRNFDELNNHEQFASAESMIAESAELLSSKGDQTWRTQEPSQSGLYLLHSKGKPWGVKIDPALRLDKCEEDPPIEEQKYATTSCRWFSPDDMQEFSVVFIRRRPQLPATAEQARWLLTSMSGRVCHPEGAAVVSTTRQ
jgi:hypothetical protein